MDKVQLEAMATRLEESGAYRVLRRITTPISSLEPLAPGCRRGLYVDVETTGLDPDRDEILELAMVPFAYSLAGEVVAVGEPFQGLRQPAGPISAEITALTGIDDALVAGRSIDLDEVTAFASSAALVIAHNASFDRRFLERFCSIFTTKAWACSMTQVDWAAEGVAGQKLVHLAASLGLFYDPHRAVDDALAGLAVLSRHLPISKTTGLAQLLAAARQITWRIWAENSPFEMKDRLKARGYRWNGEAAYGPRAWYFDAPEATKSEELAFLQREIYGREVDLAMRRVDAYDRFSARV
ncbi:3'-5' exonuclease [Phenylobacterium aquaticum]|uniref:3'-5' exonuclease n=1 Tax=Phenylobacterium aquaticum TaxID=1763816 RepID=UPI001F5D24C3|nr:3'-5' exonuclease [Phenylobacterium aquaticum]MCI3135389.1 3'-5' exonuclease [Phenylobacterium aquaticum]